MMDIDMLRPQFARLVHYETMSEYERANFNKSYYRFIDNLKAALELEELSKLEHRLGLLIEDIEDGHGDYKLLPGFYETLAIIRGMRNEN